MGKYLDNTGLNTLWTRAKQSFAPINKDGVIETASTDAYTKIYPDKVEIWEAQGSSGLGDNIMGITAGGLGGHTLGVEWTIFPATKVIKFMSIDKQYGGIAYSEDKIKRWEDAREESEVSYTYTYPNRSGTFALTNDFKTINGESIVGSGDIVIQGGSGGETRPLKEYVESGVTEKQLEPNKYYIFDSQVAESLVISFAEEDAIYLDEFMGEIKVDESPVNVTFPNIIRWNDNGSVTNTDGVLTLEAKNTYLFSVANNLGLITTIPNPSLAEATYTINGSVVSWEEVANATSYDIYNGEILLVENTTLTNIDMSTYLTDAGEYTIKVISKSNYYVDSITIITYYISTQLSTPMNLILSDTGTLSWDIVNNAEKYEVYEAEGGTLLTTVTVNYIALTSITTLTGTHTIKVKAINTTSPNVYTASELSEGVSYTWGASA